MAVLAPGTQWSHRASVRPPAAPAVRTNGAAIMVAVAAVEVAMNPRRVKDFFFEFFINVPSQATRFLVERPLLAMAHALRPDRQPALAARREQRFYGRWPIEPRCAASWTRAD